MRYAALFLLPLALSACNENTSPGADREAQVAAAPAPSERESAAEALDGIATEAIAIETMTNADIAALGEAAGNCRIVLTEVAFPSLAYEPGQRATIKLNGKLITMPATGPRAYSEGGLEVLLRPVEGEGDAGLPLEEMVVILPGAEDELGYRGYRQCLAEGAG